MLRLAWPHTARLGGRSSLDLSSHSPYQKCRLVINRLRPIVLLAHRAVRRALTRTGQVRVATFAPLISFALGFPCVAQFVLVRFAWVTHTRSIAFCVSSSLRVKNLRCHAVRLLSANLDRIHSHVFSRFARSNQMPRITTMCAGIGRFVMGHVAIMFFSPKWLAYNCIIGTELQGSKVLF